MTPKAELMPREEAAVRLHVKQARTDHRTSIWMAHMARHYGWRSYEAMAAKLRRAAWDRLADARRIRAGQAVEEPA